MRRSSPPSPGRRARPDDLFKVGERVYNLERHYNNLNGFREGSDTLPKRFLEEPSTMPGSMGQVCELDKMLEEYYGKRGWVNGVVPEAKLKELEIIYPGTGAGHKELNGSWESQTESYRQAVGGVPSAACVFHTMLTHSAL